MSSNSGGKMSSLLTSTQLMVVFIVLWITLTSRAELTTTGRNGNNALSALDDNDEDYYSSLYSMYDDDITTQAPRVIHSLGIIRSGLNPSDEDTRIIMDKVQGYNVSFSGVSMVDYSSDDVSDFKRVVKALGAVRPKAVIGPYNWPYAVATEHLRIPYLITSQVPRDQEGDKAETPFWIQLFPDVHVFARATEDIVRYFGLKKAAIFHDSDAGEVVLERLAQQPWLEVTGFRINNKTLYDTREQLKLVRTKYYNTFISILSPDNTHYLLDQGLTEYALEKYVDSHANITVLRLMMDYKSKFCALGTEYINLKRAVFHDAVRLYAQMYVSQQNHSSERFNMRRRVRKLEMDGCTGHLMFSSFGHRTESFLQLMTLEGYKTGAEPPFVQFKSERSYDTGHPVFEGFAIDILIEVSKVLNFQYNISMVPDGKFGSLKPYGWTGMVRQLVHDEADIALAPFQMSTQRAEVVDFTKPFMTKGTTVVVKRPEQTIGMFQFMSPFSDVVWVAIYVAFVGTSLMLFAVSRVNSDRQAKFTHNLRESFWYIWGTLLRGSLSGSPHAISSRIISSAWWFFCLILSSIYTANLAAFLTITIGDVGINTAQDLAIQDQFDYGTVEGSQTETFFKHTRMTYYSRMWAHMSVLSPSSMSRTTEIGFERVRKGKYAFIWDSPTIRYTIMNDCELMEIGSPFDLKGYGFAYQKNALYGEKLSWALLKLQDDGILYRLERKWWRPQNCPSQHQSAMTQSLDLETVAGMYVIILCGAVISTVLCLLQYWYSGMRRKRKAQTPAVKESEEGTARGLREEFTRSSFFDKAPDKEEGTGNHDEITYANHSPLHFRSAADWR